MVGNNKKKFTEKTIMFHEITSVSNPKIKEIVKLRDGNHRRRTGLFLIEGVREVRRAIGTNIEIIEVYSLNYRDGWFRDLIANRPEISTYLVSEAVLRKISFGNRLEGVVAVARTPDQSLEMFEQMLKSVGDPLLAVLEGVEKPGNVGAMFRSGDGAGLNGIMIADGQTDLFNPNTIRSSLGTVFCLPAVECGSAEMFAWIRDREIGMAVARCDGAIPYTDYDFRKPTAIVLGSESDGLTDLWNGEGITAISLPMLGVADSLNVSAAAAVLFYEARRQRGLRIDN